MSAVLAKTAHLQKTVDEHGVTLEEMRRVQRALERKLDRVLSYLGDDEPSD